MRAALRVLEGAGLSFRAAAIAPACGDGARLPGAARGRFTESDRAAVAACDAVFVAVDPSGERLGPLVEAPEPLGPATEAADLVWLLDPLDLAIRFQRCRSEAGEIALFGDGSLRKPTEAGRRALLDAAFQYARKHGHREVTLAFPSGVGSADARALSAHATAAAAGHTGLSFQEKPVQGLVERTTTTSSSVAAGPGVVIAPGEAWAALAEKVADRFGGAARVPTARFGAESAVLESGLAGSRPAAAAGPPFAAERAAPIAAIRAAALLCEWLGETGKGARIEAATSALLRVGLTPPRAGAGDEDSAMDIAEAVVRNL